MNALVHYAENDGIARLTLARPERHNALVPELLEPLLATLQRCQESPPRVLVLGAQGRSFSSGGDVERFYHTPMAERRTYAAGLVGTLHRTILALLSLPCPTIATVQGMVTGGSAGLVLACDIAVGGPATSFAPWYTAVGYSPDGGWTTLMPERIGRARALDVQLLNRRIDARQAYDWGILQHLAEDGDVAGLANDLARRISLAKSGAMRRTLTLTRPMPERVAAGLNAEYRHFLEQIETPEADQGMAEFLGQRR